MTLKSSFEFPVHTGKNMAPSGIACSMSIVILAYAACPCHCEHFGYCDYGVSCNMALLMYEAIRVDQAEDATQNQVLHPV